MLGILSSVQQQQNVWRKWVDCIESRKEKLSLSKAAIVTSEGHLAASSSKFVLNPNEINDIRGQFERFSNEVTPVPVSRKLNIKDTTYVVRDCTPHMLVAFNGSKYVIVTRSAKGMLIVAVCTSRAKFEDAARWLHRLTDQLSLNNF